jgi:hypothetical protein
MTDQDIAPAVIEFVRYIAGVDVEASHRLYQDLRIRGTDAVELLAGLNARFGTDFSELDCERHFPGEHPSLWVRVRELWEGSEKVFVPIRVAEIIEAVRRGRWTAGPDN